MNQKVFVLGLILFSLGIYASQWTNIAIAVGIGGGFLMGMSTTKKLSKR